MSFRQSVFGIVAVLLSVGACFATAAETGKPPFPERREVRALPQELTWVNTAKPLRLEDLRGKFVLLDFWTYCCINCMHILPELEKLEKAYPKNLVVIGVHSAKFSAEQETRNIVEAILRYKIEHPVVNDANHALWNAFGVEAWPTLVLIDPEGYAVWAASGESTFTQIDPLLKNALPYYRNKGVLDETPLRFELESYRAEPTPLRFPGKVLADEKGQRLFIADSSHNRIVIARMDGTLLEVVGSGVRGKSDGESASAEFNDPQGMALDGQSLYVADTKNHALRKIDLAGRKVQTIAGTGEQRRERPYVRKYNAKSTSLDSPWDLWIREGELYVAMAGSHQIWRMKLEGATIAPYAGNAREDIEDGPLLPEFPYQRGFASFAQPSGLTSDGTWLYVADSEGSSIRAVPFNPRGTVKTVVGTSQLSQGRLFTFGDVDGPRSQARLQHPLGVTYYEGRLFVADTYNNKIRVVEPSSGATTTLVGGKAAEAGDDRPRLDEPGGISAAAGRLYVADTNNHQIRLIDLREGNKVSTLRISGLLPPKPPVRKLTLAEAFAGAQQENAPVATVRPEKDTVRVVIELQLPVGFKLNEQAPMSYLVEALPATGGKSLLAEDSAGKLVRLEKPTRQFEIALPVGAIRGEQTLRVGLSYYYCRSGAEGLCKAGSIVWTVPLRLSESAVSSTVLLRHQAR